MSWPVAIIMIVVVVGLIGLVTILALLTGLLRKAQIIDSEGRPEMDRAQLKGDRDARIATRATDIQEIVDRNVNRPGDRGINRGDAKIIIEAADAIIREARLDLTAEDNPWLNTVLCERPNEGQHAVETPFSLGMIRSQFPSQRMIMVTVLVVVVLQAITLIATIAS